MTTTEQRQRDRRKQATRKPNSVTSAAKTGGGRRGWIIGLVAFVLVVAAVVVAIVTNGSSSDTAAQDALGDDQRPAGITADGGFAFGSTFEPGTGNEGSPVLTVAVDYTCIYCAEFEDRFAADLREQIAAGDLTYVIYPVAILDETGDYSGFSGRAANAVATVATHAPEFAYSLHEALFGLYTDWSWDPAKADTEPGDEDIAELATFLGVPQEVADLIDDGLYTDWVEASTTDFTGTGLGTPAVMVNDSLVMDWQTAPDLATLISSVTAATED